MKRTGKVEMMDAMITLVGIVVLKVGSERQCFTYVSTVHLCYSLFGNDVFSFN